MNWQEKTQPEKKVQPEKKSEKRRKTECIELSETKLLDALGIEPLKENCSYHCITGGDVDSLSYLKVILRHQKVIYCLLSTWCMSAEDILQIEKWIEEKKIEKIDFFVGEIFTIESSANVNTNPRTENGCLTISKELHNFYKEFYSSIKSFE